MSTYLIGSPRLQVNDPQLGRYLPRFWALLLAMISVATMRARFVAQARVAVVGLLALAGFAGSSQAEDLTSSVQIVRSGLLLNPSTGTFDEQVVVTNRSPDTLLGPLWLALESATPANVALYNSYGRTAGDADYVPLPLPTGTLAPGASVATTVRLLTYGQSVGAIVFSVHGARLSAANSAQITVSATYDPVVLRAPGQTSVGAGWEVLVDGVVRGVTNAAGQLTLTVPTSAKVVAVVRAPNDAGSAYLPSLAPGSNTTVKVTVDEGKEISAGSVVRLEQVQQGVLLRNGPTVSLRFFKNESAVRLVRLYNVSLVDGLGYSLNLGELFTLQADGSASAPGVAFSKALVDRYGPFQLKVGGSDAAGTLHVATEAFRWADYRVRVQLIAPPSNPALSLAGVRITASLLNSDIRFVAQSDASGYIVLPDVPGGNLSFRGSTAADGITYRATGSRAINRHTLLRLTLRGPADLLANVPPISAGPLPAAARPADAGRAGTGAGPERASFTPEQTAAREAAHSRARARVPVAAQSEAAATSVSVYVFASEQNVIVEGAVQLTVKKGTKKVTLKYTVFTEEYPEYVVSLSSYNDVWTLSVLSTAGAPLFDIERQINSQLIQEPVWPGNGDTGEIRQVIDVEALAAAADTTLNLSATSVNIGDGRLTTAVYAILDTTEPLIIKTITPDANPAKVTRKGPANDGNYYSIPRPTATNTLQRTFDVELSKPTGLMLTKVSVELRSGAGALLQAVLQDVAPGTPGVTVVSQDDRSAKLRVRVTHDNPASTVASQPPPTRDTAYRFIVKGTAADGTELRDEKEARGKRALWRMPDGISRYGRRDPGGDDWVARGTYNWLLTYRSLISAIDDISGEHGRDIGHDTHGRGTDIDAYHFYRFPGAVSGGQNYTALKNDMLAAFGTLATPVPPAATAAFIRVAAWITATRNGLTNLATLNSVRELLYCYGTAAGTLPEGWCSALIRTGTVSRTVVGPTVMLTETLNFGGAFADPKVFYRDDHNDHLHVTLHAELIGE